jgi:hypothetical protein
MLLQRRGSGTGLRRRLDRLAVAADLLDAVVDLDLERLVARVVLVPVALVPVAVAGVSGLGLAVVFLVVDGRAQGGFLGQQRLAVGDRNAVVVGVDFAEGQEAVAVAAVVDEGGLERGLHPRHLRQIDIALQLGLAADLVVEFLDPATVEDDDPDFRRVGCIDQHTLGHRTSAPGRAQRNAPWAKTRAPQASR